MMKLIKYVCWGKSEIRLLLGQGQYDHRVGRGASPPHTPLKFLEGAKPHQIAPLLSIKRRACLRW